MKGKFTVEDERTHRKLAKGTFVSHGGKKPKIDMKPA